MKKIVSIIIVLAISFLSLIACGNSKSEISDPARLARRFANAGYEVRFFINDDEIADVIEGVASVEDIECMFMVEKDSYYESDDQSGLFIYCRNLRAAEKLTTHFNTYLKNPIYYSEGYFFTVETLGTFVFAGSVSLWENANI